MLYITPIDQIAFTVKLHTPLPKAKAPAIGSQDPTQREGRETKVNQYLSKATQSTTEDKGCEKSVLIENLSPF